MMKVYTMTIPPNARRVFKGEIFEVYQWDQELFDGSKAVFERVKRPDTVAVIPVVKGKILIADEEQPDHVRGKTLICGRVEDGELPLETAKRELLEEAGHSSQSWELLKSYSPVSKMEWRIHVFIARDAKKVAGPKLDPGERITLKKIGLDRLFSLMRSSTWKGTEVANDLISLSMDEKKLKAFKRRLGLQ